jgi:hypothetical protein
LYPTPCNSFQCLALGPDSSSTLLRRLKGGWTEDLYGVWVALGSCPEASTRRRALRALTRIVLLDIPRAYERVRSSPQRISEWKDSPTLMSERPSFWQRLFGRTGSSSLSARQQKVSDYIIGRMENDVPFRQVLREDYVRRNCSQAEVEKIVSSPEFIERARERLGESFQSEEFKL